MATAIRPDGRKRARPSRDEVDPAAVELLERHGAQLMATARRYAAMPEDAEDAYQRGVEILLTKAPTTDPAELLPWLKTVVKHEAFAVRKQSERHGMPSEPGELEPHLGRDPGPADIAERRDRLRLGAEALGRLKPQEVRALMLRAEGLSYQEICEATGWTYTKVNRCLSEGRRSFVERVAGIETGLECARVAPVLSALAYGEATADDLARVRPHLRGCLACRARLREYRDAPSRVAAFAPLGLFGAFLSMLRDSAHSGSQWLHSRAAFVASRWDGIADAVAAHKAAAVAASTLALAGGGAATVATLPQGAGAGSGAAQHHGRPAARLARHSTIAGAVPHGAGARAEPTAASRPSHASAGPRPHPVRASTPTATPTSTPPGAVVAPARTTSSAGPSSLSPSAGAAPAPAGGGGGGGSGGGEFAP